MVFLKGVCFLFFFSLLDRSWAPPCHKAKDKAGDDGEARIVLEEKGNEAGKIRYTSSCRVKLA